MSKEPTKKAAKKGTKESKDPKRRPSRRSIRPSLMETPAPISLPLSIGRVESRQGQKSIGEQTYTGRGRSGSQGDDPFYQTQDTFNRNHDHRGRQEHPKFGQSPGQYGEQRQYSGGGGNNQYRMQTMTDNNNNRHMNIEGGGGQQHFGYATQQSTQQLTQQGFGQQQYQQQSQAQSQAIQQQLRNMGNNNGPQQMRYKRVADQIQMNLLPKKDKLISQIQRIEMKVEEVKYAERQIEEATRAEIDVILGRLKDASGFKIGVLNTSLRELKREVEQVNQTIQDFQYIDDLGSQEAYSLFETVEQLCARNIKTTIDVSVNDLPNDIQGIKKQSQQIQVMQQMIQFKNEVIWKIQNEQNKDQQQIKRELERQASEEFRQWAGLVDQFQAELSRYNQLQCQFCGIKFDYQLINSNCNLNNGQETDIKCQFVDKPPQEFIGTLRHYFSKTIM